MLSALLYIFYCSVISKYDPLLAYALLVTAFFLSALKAHGIFYRLFGSDHHPEVIEFAD